MRAKAQKLKWPVIYPWITMTLIYTKGCLQRRVKYPVSKTETFSLGLIVPVQEQMLKAITNQRGSSFFQQCLLCTGGMVWRSEIRPRIGNLNLGGQRTSHTLQKVLN